MIDPLLDKVEIALTEEDVPRLLEIARSDAAIRPTTVAFINPHAINLCYKDPGFLTNLLDSDHIYRDGSGVKILYKMLGRDAGMNLNGTDLIPRIIGLYTGQKIALMGTSSPWLEQAGDIIAARGGQIVSAIDGFQDDEAYVVQADHTKPALIILGMGMPKQERVAKLLKSRLTHPCMIVSGGAVLDFISGRVARAPAFLRKVGMEWVFRLCREPKRLFSRYVIGNWVFLYRGICNTIQSKRTGS